MLLDRYGIRFIDELDDEVKRGGAPSLDENLDMILESIPKDLSQDEWEDAWQQAMDAAIWRYRKEVEEPAAAILRERKASQPSAVKKVEVALCGVDNDADFYRELLEGIEPELEVAEAPALSSLTLRLSWAPGFPFRGLFSGFISSCHNNIMVLYVGQGGPCSSSPWFYLVYDSWASSISVIPKLPSRAVNLLSHGYLGTGVSVLCHPSPRDYVLAELLLCREEDGHTSNKAELFLWWTSGCYAGRWIRKNVKLPLPSKSEEQSSRLTYNFRADTVLAIGSRGLCWFDLLQGALICDNVLSDCPRFRFIPLPQECVIDTGYQRRGEPTEYRSVTTTGIELPYGNVRIRFVTMDGQGQDRLVTFWDIQRCHTTGWDSEWVKCLSINLRELPLGNIPTDIQGLQPIRPIICTSGDFIVYLCFYDPKPIPFGFVQPEVVDDCPSDVPIIGSYVRLRLDMLHKRVLSAVELPRECIDSPDPYVFATDFNKRRDHWHAEDQMRVLVEEVELCDRGKSILEHDRESDEESDDTFTFRPTPMRGVSAPDRGKSIHLRTNRWPSPMRGVSAPGRPFPPPPGKLSVGSGLGLLLADAGL